VTPDAPKSNVDPKALALSIDNFAADEPGNEAEDYPADDAHVFAFS
jgi:hypothetical protein